MAAAAGRATQDVTEFIQFLEALPAAAPEAGPAAGEGMPVFVMLTAAKAKFATLKGEPVVLPSAPELGKILERAPLTRFQSRITFYMECDGGKRSKVQPRDIIRGVSTEVRMPRAHRGEGR